MVPLLTPLSLASTEHLVNKMRANPRNVNYTDLFEVCEHFFGNPRQAGTSHAVFQAPWPGNPRVNIQNDHGIAKPYQVRQVLVAIDKLGG